MGGSCACSENSGADERLSDVLNNVSDSAPRADLTENKWRWKRHRTGIDSGTDGRELKGSFGLVRDGNRRGWRTSHKVGTLANAVALAIVATGWPLSKGSTAKPNGDCRSGIRKSGLAYPPKIGRAHV